MKAWEVEYDSYGAERWFGGTDEGMWSITTDDDIEIMFGGDACMSDKRARKDELARQIAALPLLLELYNRVNNDTDIIKVVQDIQRCLTLLG